MRTMMMPQTSVAAADTVALSGRQPAASKHHCGCAISSSVSARLKALPNALRRSTGCVATWEPTTWSAWRCSAKGAM